MKTIKELVLSAKNGNKKAFDKLYELTHNDVWYNCLSLLKDEENAKDIMQETYITAFLKLDTLNDEQKFCGWITSIAVNKCKNKLKGKVEYQIDDEVLIVETETDELMLPEEYITKAEKRKVLLQIMEDTLSFNQYQTVLMFYFDEMSISEIAQGLEISEGTVKSRLNSSRAKMKTAIEDYEKKSGDKLHGVVVVPFFTTIFKEEAKSLAVPNITIKLPNGQTLATSATKGIATGAKSTVSSIVKATATATVKTKVIAVVCGATILAGISAVGISILAGCNAEKEPTEPSVISSTVQTSTVPTTVPKTTVPKAVKDLVDKGEIKVDKDGNITDKNGKKVEVKDGKVEVKTDDGKTVTVKVDDVKTTVSNNNNSNKGNTEKKEDTSSKKDNTSKTNTSDNNKKPASKPSNSSSNNQKPAKPSESSKAETTSKKYKYYKHHDAVTKYHPAVTKKHDREWIVTGTHEEPVYDYDWVNVCNNCGMVMKDANEEKQHLTWELETNGAGAYHAEKRQIQVGTKTVEDGYWKEAYTEVVSKAWTETITPAYDEEVSENDHWDKKVPIN
ncbi:sigma-70 family RNA polymerase sigma factor [Ruminococcus sp. FMB-CY1]|uniref:sigma-70 family RNA polymerase sigma factor n=1 Tax=unclassified Ruminococcus TaxID=2608920 RepID=UPI00208F6E96|nr:MULTISPECIES: sigma-70 family RNA polymerase sigma factor [unclassified Ruminococcus]USP70328.1 sigma-70 family RNA polymerase sigma factor [Ruminococcus sp. FMBCY1]WBX58507.1 sigma-70 family RNA polymerase sigma factor [Ruminococcus sp. FMB-CY1]